MYCFVFMFRCMLMFYGRFKDRNKTCMRLVFLGWRLGRRPFKNGGCPVLLGGGLGCPARLAAVVLSCRNSQSFHLETSQVEHSFKAYRWHRPLLPFWQLWPLLLLLSTGAASSITCRFPPRPRGWSHSATVSVTVEYTSTRSSASCVSGCW